MVIDRFHVQKLALDALQEIRIKHRWEALDIENDAIENARNKSIKYTPELLRNGDTLKQLLARAGTCFINQVVNGLKTNQKEPQYFLNAIQI